MQEPVIEDNGLAWWAGGREDFELMIASGDPDDWALPVTCLSDIVYRTMITDAITAGASPGGQREGNGRRH